MSEGLMEFKKTDLVEMIKGKFSWGRPRQRWIVRINDGLKKCARDVTVIGSTDSKMEDCCRSSKCFSKTVKLLVEEDEYFIAEGNREILLGDVFEKKIQEDFSQFIEIHDMSGKRLSDIILKPMTDLGLNLHYLTGQGYDGAAAMSL
ncbi:Hypothetical protein CINCED_3A000590 [Cinara cedri]|uniref:DUF4371 domain-containing protein n=1 Tax=Cinara cedri TaxID=506608 RepID=A0A5E4MMU1_9HEMI|nr:Hypothetical protein CINCED_3A000590 [Cinara cedri]